MLFHDIEMIICVWQPYVYMSAFFDLVEMMKSKVCSGSKHVYFNQVLIDI